MDPEDETQLRAARLGAPVSRENVVVLDRVAAALTSATGLIVSVVAPGGYGKTTQVAAWSAADARPVAWVDIEAADNDASTLASAVVHALGSVSGFDAEEVSSTRRSPDGIATIVVPALGRALLRCESPFVLVIDDVHLLEAPPAIDVIDALAHGVPDHSTLVLISRSGPSTALTRVRAHRGTLEITASDLSLDADEASQVLDGMGVAADGDAIERIVRDTEGWPVGVRLAAIAQREAPSRSAPSNRDHGDLPREAADYVRAEWLPGLSDDDVELLTRSSVLDWLSGPLCDHVLGRTGTARALSRLEDSRLVVIPLDRRHDTYRMHRLLRDILQADLERFDPGASRLTHARASEWFEAQGDIDRALHHALGAEDLARAEQLVNDHTVPVRTSGRYVTVERWFASFPDGYLTSRPVSCLMAAVAALGDSGGEGDTVSAWMRHGEHALAQSPDRDEETELRYAAFRALAETTSISDGLADAERARRGLPPGVWHATACLAHGAMSFAIGDDLVAEAMFKEAAAEAHISAAPSTVTVSRAHLAVVHHAAGAWPRAASLARSAREVVREHGMEQYPTQALVTAMSALVEATEGNPEAARAEWLLSRHNLAYLEDVVPWVNIQSRLALARTSLLLSDRAGARTLLDEAQVVLNAQPDALRVKAQIAEIEEIVHASKERAPWGPSSLSTAELRVLNYLPTNLTIAEIAARLFVSRNTVKSQAISIYRKLGASTRGEAVEAAQEIGLLSAAERPRPG